MFDIPESDMPEALKMLMWKQRVLMVTVGPEVDGRADEGKKIHI